MYVLLHGGSVLLRAKEEKKKKRRVLRTVTECKTQHCGESVLGSSSCARELGSPTTVRFRARSYSVIDTACPLDATLGLSITAQGCVCEREREASANSAARIVFSGIVARWPVLKRAFRYFWEKRF